MKKKRENKDWFQLVVVLKSFISSFQSLERLFCSKIVCMILWKFWTCFSLPGKIFTTSDFFSLFSFFLRSLRSYFVVKSLHFLKESKYFSLSFLYYETKWQKKIKMYPWNWEVSICYSAMEQFTDLLFEYVKSVM